MARSTSAARAHAPSDSLQVETLEDRIRRRAYERWLENGRPAGTDVVDWLAAEQEILDEQQWASPPDRSASLAQCSRCGVNETSLFINGVPVCLECESRMPQAPDVPWSTEATPPNPLKKTGRRQEQRSERPGFGSR